MIPARRWDHVSNFCTFPASVIHGEIELLHMLSVLHLVTDVIPPGVDYQPVEQNPSDPLGV